MVNAMKKICYITTTTATMKGLIIPAINYLHEKGGFNIYLICCPDSEFSDIVPSYAHYIPIKMQRGISIDGIKVILSLIKILKRERFDLIQYSTPNASLYASIAGFITNVPNRLYCQWGLVFEGFSGIKRNIFKGIERLVCRLSTWVEPDSRGNLIYCRELGFYGENKSSVLLYGSAKGVDLKVFDIAHKNMNRIIKREKYMIPNEAFVFGFVGSLTGDKGTNELISAFRDLSAQYSDVWLLLVGDTEKEYSLNAELLQWAKDCKRIVFTGLSKTVPQEMATMDCYVTPSYREGFGTTVIEAGAMGLPVITSNIPGPTDAIKDGENGLVVEKKNTEQLAKAMITLYKDRDLCRKMGVKGLELVKERYDQKIVFQAMYEDRLRLLGEIK